jgi:hypothetical protein
MGWDLQLSVEISLYEKDSRGQGFQGSSEKLISPQSAVRRENNGLKTNAVLRTLFWDYRILDPF